MIAYRIVNGLCVEVKSAAADYQVKQGEMLVQGDVLPTRESLSDPAAWASSTAPQRTLTAENLASALVSARVVTQAQIDGAMTPIFVSG